MSSAQLQDLMQALGPSLTVYLAAFGLATLAYLYIGAALSLLRGIYTTFLRPAKNPKKYGEWAVVTGATDGIGKAYCEQLAAKGMKIFLISRSEDKLSAVASEIAATYKVETETLAIDFANSESIYSPIESALGGLDIGVLVNNVGISYEHPAFFLELDQDRIDKHVRLNIISVNQMTRIVLPGMVERKRGAIINVSSGSAKQPSPLLTVYAATKAYVDFFSQGLQKEYAKDGIVVQSLMPLFVTSKLSKIRKPSLFTPTPKTFVRSALRTLGYDQCTTGYLWHTAQLNVLGALPGSMAQNQLYGMHLAIRKKALRKQAERAKAE